MADDLVPAEGGTSFLDKLNLPRLIAGPAGEAIAKLIGGAVDIPAAWLQQVAQGVREDPSKNGSEQSRGRCGG